MEWCGWRSAGPAHGAPTRGAKQVRATAALVSTKGGARQLEHDSGRAREVVRVVAQAPGPGRTAGLFWALPFKAEPYRKETVELLFHLRFLPSLRNRLMG